MSRFFYTLLIYLILPLTPIKLFWRSLRQPEYRAHWAERFGFFTQKITRPVIWLHCVSVGETRAAEPLIKALITRYPQHQILITHATPTGRATSEQLFGEQVLRCYLPYDAPCLVKRFLQHFKPQLGVLMETELWFNLMAACKERNMPLLLLNARLSEKSAKGYARFDSLMREGLQQLSVIAAQTEQDALRFKNFGANHVVVMGNLKFEVTPPDDAFARGQALRDMLGLNRPVFLAASTRAHGSESEEKLILQAIKAAQIPNLLTIIVPRHPQRFDEVAQMIEQAGLSYCRRSGLALGNVAGDMSAQAVMLGDSMGEMFTYFAACDVAFIGGSLLPLGGQNLIEASAMAKPVLIGEHTFNFKQAADQATQLGAAQRVLNVDELAEALRDLMENPSKREAMANAGLAFVQASRGATERALALIVAKLVR